MKFLKGLFGSSKDSSGRAPLKQDEREAILDLLLLGIYFDNHLSLGESQEFESVVDSIEWESSLSITVYIYDATVRVRSARTSEEAITEFIEHVARRLSSNDSREYAFELLNRLFRTDGKSDTKKAFCRRVKATFETC